MEIWVESIELQEEFEKIWLFGCKLRDIMGI